MKKENIKFTEEKIKEYFNILEKINLLNNLIISLEEKKEILKDKNRNLQLDFNIDIKSIVINDMPKSNGDGTSYFESNIMKQIQNNERMIEKIEEDILNQKDEIFRLEIKNEKMKNIINIIRNDYKDLLMFRYHNNMSELEIAIKLNISTAQYQRNKKKMISSIYNLLVMQREI